MNRYELGTMESGSSGETYARIMESPTGNLVRYKDHCSLVDEQRAEIARLQALRDALKLQAQVHAQEARAANSTIAEIYQCVSGATGEVGNWHGAEPVREAFRKLQAQLEGVSQVTLECNEELLRRQDAIAALQAQLATAKGEVWEQASQLVVKVSEWYEGHPERIVEEFQAQCRQQKEQL